MPTRLHIGIEEPQNLQGKIDLRVKHGEKADPERRQRQDFVPFSPQHTLARIMKIVSQPTARRTVNGMPISEAISSGLLCACAQMP